MGNLRIQRTQELELSATITVKFINKTADYQRGAQEAKRMQTYSTKKTNYEAAVVFDDVTARTIASKLLYNEWTARNVFTFQLPRRYLYLEPTDVITLVDKDTLQRYRVRITKKVDSRSGVSQCEAVAEIAAIYQQHTVTSDAVASNQVLVDGSKTVNVVLDMPAITPTDGSLVIYFAMGGTSTSGWTGASLWTSQDGGLTYQDTGLNATQGTVIGTTVSQLDAWNGTSSPDTNTVTVTVKSGTLQSIATATLATGANTAAIQTPSGWETFQFTTATPTGTPNQYVLSGLVRGLDNTTTQAETVTPAGAQFVLLNDTGVIAYTYTSSQIGTTLDYKIVPIGNDPTTVPAQTVVLSGTSMTPYPPIIEASGADADGNATILWQSQPLPGQTPGSDEFYDIEFYWDSSYTGVVTTFHTTSGALGYTAAQQVVDYGVAQSVLYFQIFQVSTNDLIGRGYGAKGQVVVNPFTNVQNSSIKETANPGHTQNAIVTDANGVSVLTTETVNYTEYTGTLANPERGFARQVSNCQNVQFTPSGVQSLKITNQISTYWMLVYLNSYVNTAIPSTILSNITANFNALRLGGAKAWLRFEYDQSGAGIDATKAQMKAHIDQLAPIIQANADVIAVMDAGFIGSWGEWAASNNFGNYGAFTTQNWNDRKEILEYLLAAVPAQIPIMLRTPGYKQHMYGTTALTTTNAFNGSSVARLGHHDDAFLADASDQGTYGLEQTIGFDRGYVAQETLYVPRGGETDHYDSSNLTQTACPAALSDLTYHHWSLLNDGYEPNVLAQWQSGGCYTNIANNLGYRFTLVQGTYTTSTTANGTISVSMVINNRGYAAPFKQRTAYIVLRNVADNTEYKIAMAADIRLWSSGQRTVTEVLTAPNLPAGQYLMFLWLPDAAAGLQSNPEYSIQIANSSMWEATTGYNSLNHTLTVS